MKARQILAWVMLSIAIILIFYALYSSYFIFMGKRLPPEIFKAQEKQVTDQATGKTMGFQAQIQQQIQGIMASQIQGMIPADSLPKLLNLSSWSIFIFILLSAATRIFGLGIKLFKTEN